MRMPETITIPRELWNRIKIEMDAATHCCGRGCCSGDHGDVRAVYEEMRTAEDAFDEQEIANELVDEAAYQCSCATYTNPFCPTHGEKYSQAEPED